MENGTTSFAPGRICLFGEHQDYHGLPVIAGAIDLGLYIEFKGYRDDQKISIDMPDIEKHRVIDIEYPIEYIKKRDYLASSLNVLERNGIKITKGFNCELRGTLPIEAGASSSSAMVVCWLNFLSNLVTNGVEDKVQLAKWANHAEVVEFGEAGGWMDHVTSSVGGLLFINADFSINAFQVPDNFHLVLGDSLEKKETVENLRTMRTTVEEQVKEILSLDPGFKINKKGYFTDEFIENNKDKGWCLKEEFPMVYANLMNASITLQAREVFKNQGMLDGNIVVDKIGDLLNEHHHYLRDYLGISTDKIESLIEASLNAGASGCKINGSGFGGCMFTLCKNTEIQENVAQAIDGEGGKSYKIKISPGSRLL
ncbi:MAG: mevalonate kinase [Candidatus Hodarchaeota archaeon]